MHLTNGGAPVFAGIEIVDCSVEIPAGTLPVDWATYESLPKTIESLAGRLRVRTAGGTIETIVLSPEWIRATMPDFAAASVTEWKLDPAALRSDGTNPCAPGWVLRHEAELLAWAKASETIEFAINVGRVGPPPHHIPVVVRSPSGTEVFDGEAAAEQGEAVFKVSAREEGLYRIELGKFPYEFTVLRADRPLALATAPRRASFLGWTGDLRLTVPAGIEQFSVHVLGARSYLPPAPHEAVSISVLDAAGRTLAQADNLVWGTLQIRCPANASQETVVLRCARPTEGAFEDYSLRVVGIPPVLLPVSGSGTAPIGR